MEDAPDSVHVLHVDDDPEFADMAAQFLEREDPRFDVVTETSGADGITRLREEHIDCIISDYDMPKQNGLEFLKAVRADNPAIPFVLFTGKGSEEIASQAITTGVSDYIQKGSGTEQYTILANRIGNLVEQYHAVRLSELSHRAMDTAEEGISLVNEDGTFSYVNPAFARLFEYEQDELVGKHWKILYHNEEAKRLEHDILPAVEETGYWSGETVRLTKSGDRLVTDHRLASTDEEVIVCTAKDVTPETAADPEPLSGFELLVDAFDDFAFFTLDHEGYITRWNRGAERLEGYSATEIIGEHVSKLFPEGGPEEGPLNELIETAKAEGSVSTEGWALKKDGSRYWAKSTISASYDSSGTIRGFGNVIEA